MSKNFRAYGKNIMEKFLIQINKYFINVVLIFATDSFLAFANKLCMIIGIIIMIMTDISSSYFGKVHIILNKKKFLLWGILIYLIIASMLVHREANIGHLTKILVLTFGMFFSEKFQLKALAYIYIKILSAIAIISLITFLLYPLISKIKFLPIISNGGMDMLCLGLTNISISIGAFFRNWGPFWEPGVYQAYLIIALIFSIKYLEKNIRYIVLFSITIITTFSTTGYICLILLGAYWLMHSNKMTKPQLFIILFAIAGLIFLILSNPNIIELVFGKFIPNSRFRESLNSRFLSTLANLDIISKWPLIGVGLTRLNIFVFEFMHKHNVLTYSNTNGLLMNFSVYGILFGMLYWIMIYKFCKSVEKHLLTRSVLFLCICILLCTEPFLQSVLFNTKIFYGISDVYRNRKKSTEMKIENEKTKSFMVNKYNSRKCM